VAAITDIHRPDAPGSSGSQRARPVLLGTLSVRIDPEAERMALESALEAGSTLILANVMVLRPMPLTNVLAPECANLPQEEDLEAVRDTAARAAAVGIQTELLRILSPRPVASLIELATEREAGLLVFGPERSLLPRMRFRSAANAVRRHAPCLVWIGGESY
jgi:nucleotide-binding universal stress UspA family protein